MSLRKVYGGTPVGNESRCDTCAQARIIQGYAESERIVFCDAMYPSVRVPFKVMQCSMYEDRRLPRFAEMRDIAWEIRSKSAGSVAGFVTVPDAAEVQGNEASREITVIPPQTPADGFDDQ